MTTRSAARPDDGDSLDRMAAELREIDRRPGIERTLGAGELILARFFGGDAETWRNRKRSKANLIRRLAEREDCPFARSALNEAVGIYLALAEAPSVRTFSHIAAGHVAAVLSLSATERERLLTLAERERMSVRALRAKIVEMRRACGERRGRPRASQEQRVLVVLAGAERRFAAALKELEGIDCLEQPTRQHLRRLANRLAGLEARLTALSAFLPDGMLDRSSALRRSLGQA